MQPIPSKVIAWSVKIPKFLDVNFVHSCQVIHDKINELGLSSAITIYKSAEALGILSPAVARNQYARLAAGTRWIRWVNRCSDREVGVGLTTYDSELLPPWFMEADANLVRKLSDQLNNALDPFENEKANLYRWSVT